MDLSQDEPLVNSFLVKVFSYFNRKDLCTRAALVCSHWNHLAGGASLWRSLDIKFDGHVYDDAKILSAIGAISDHSNALRSLTFQMPRRTVLVDGFKSAVSGSSFDQLTKLDLSHNYWVTPVIIDVITSRMGNLMSVSLDDCRNVTDSSVLLIGQRCQHLTNVSMKCCYNVSDSGLFQMFSTMPESLLHTVDIEGCWPLTDKTMLLLVEHQHDSLTKLALRGGKLTDDSIVNGVRLLQGLTFLSISGAPSLTDHSLEAISDSLTALSHLHITSAANFTSAGLIKFFSMSPHLSKNLTQLKLNGIFNLDSAVCVALAHCLPALRVLNLDFCRNIDNVGLCAFADQLRQLIALSLRNCQLNDVSGLGKQDAFPQLIFLDLTSGFARGNIETDKLESLTSRSPNPVYIIDGNGRLVGHGTDIIDSDTGNTVQLSTKYIKSKLISRLGLEFDPSCCLPSL